jgi:hypothetical protein
MICCSISIIWVSGNSAFCANSLQSSTALRTSSITRRAPYTKAPDSANRSSTSNPLNFPLTDIRCW